MINLKQHVEVSEEVRKSKVNKDYSVLVVFYKGRKLFDSYLDNDLKEKIELIDLATSK